jgi:hypothetical protein
MFIDRGDELKALSERHGGGAAEFVVIYGRRGVGKSELIEHFIRGKEGVRLLAREEAETIQLRRFSERLASFFGDEVLKKNPFSSWDAFFTYLAEKSKERIVIALDEFPYLAGENPALPSIIQDYWDNRLKKTKIFLILCGSSISMMEKKVLGHKSPLYGRRTGQILLKPFSFKDAFRYLEKPIREAVEFYSVFGGMPAYLIQIDRGATLLKNIADKVLKKDAPLYRDVEFLLREELKEPRYYFSVLHSIAKGNTRIGEIMNDTGLKKGIVAKYLSVLCDLHLVKREVPVTESLLKSRRGIYVLRDNFFRFWFKYVYPHKEEVESGRQGEIIKEFEKALPQYVSSTFEEICREGLLEMEKRGKIFHFTNLGKWWHKGEEIDLVGLNKDTGQILLAECKWSEKVDAVKVLEELKQKAPSIGWKNKREPHYAVFAKSFVKKVADQNVSCLNVDDLEESFR